MLLVAIVVSGFVYLFAAVRQVKWLVYLLKPGTMALIIALAAKGLQAHPASGYAWAILVGLLFSVAGDVFLMLPRNLFLPGLASFFAAHLCYVYALWAVVPTRLTVWDGLTGLAMLGYAAWMGRYLLLGLRERRQESLRVPVVLYISVISVMLWRALGPLFQAVPDWYPAGMVAAGAVLFCISDSVLGWDRFVRKVAARDVLVMSTYFAAQTLIALSIGV